MARSTHPSRRASGIAVFVLVSVMLSPLALALSVVGCGGGNDEQPPVAHPKPIASATTSASDIKPAPLSTVPVTEKRPVSDVFFGQTVTEDYRWLENAADPAVKAWNEVENKATRAVLASLPGRDPLHARISDLLGASSADRFDLIWRGKTLFALKDQPPKQQPFLVALKSPDDAASERVVLDPNVLDAKGKTAIDWYTPSLDGKLVAVSLSEGGSESGTVHVYDVATGKERVGDVIPRVNGGTAGGSLAWNAEGSGFWYTRYPREGERPPVDLDFFQQVWFHKLRGPETAKPEPAATPDVYSIGKDFPRIAEVFLKASDDGKWILATVANGDGGEFAHYLLDGKNGKATWKQFAVYADKVVQADFGRDGNLWLLSLAGSPRGKLLRMAPAAADLAKAKTIVPESDVVIQHFQTTKTRLYVVDLAGGPSQIRVLDLEGKADKGADKSADKGASQVPILPVSAVQQIEHLDGDEVLFRNQSFLEPPGWYRYDAKANKTTKSALFKTAPADFSDAEVLRDVCTSKDGTKVPITILQKKGVKLDSNNLTLLNAYGGYSVSLSPRFNPIHRVWLDQGGVFALANLRGGGEFGEAWHHAGNLTNKQHVFDDFLSCAQLLIDKKYTRAERLGIIGGSNGGLLMGAVVTQRPDLFGAVVTKVGIYDMLRVELTPNGAFNVTEFGTVKDPAHFKALYAYSPYHHVTDGTKYPPILFMTGANDPRVDPYNSRKMVARLPAASPSSGPFLLRTSGDTGHGMGTPLSEEIDQETDVYGFLFKYLGHTYVPKK